MSTKLLLLAAFVMSAAHAQWLDYPAPGIPRLPNGKPNLSAPAPRASDGHPDISGVWTGPGAGGYDRNIARDLRPSSIQPWAERLYQQRVLNEGAGSPRAACLPDPFAYYHAVDVARIVQTPALIVILYQGTTNSVHRTVFTDGRKLPVDPNPTWLGYSVGHWDGDTLVVDTAGFNDRGWLDIEGHPHSEALHITERFRRRDLGHMDLEMIYDDPKTFTRPFTIKMPQTLTPDTDLIESVCENDNSPPHMLGGISFRLAPDALSKYTGTYEFSPGKTATITLGGELLFLRLDTNPLKLPLVPDSETRFVSRTNGDLLDFTRDAAGTVTGFVFHQGSGDRKAVRK
ncbi:MAG TPA: DUF3471 domain-containing protein [Bryobacteraceae bacterium]|jgi:hypothetical protein|nr:DUF3471 domain-containing protein [Bryobacteraceae bacterium]